MSGADFATGATEHLRQYTVPTVLGPTKITHGVINDAAQRAYSMGQCHALALAMHERGYRMGAVVEAPDEWEDHHEEYREPQQRVPDRPGAQYGRPDITDSHHFFAYDPHSPAHGIDIEGRRPIREIVHGYGDDNLTHEEVTPSEVYHAIHYGGYPEPHMTAARSIARKIAPKVRSPKT